MISLKNTHITMWMSISVKVNCLWGIVHHDVTTSYAKGHSLSQVCHVKKEKRGMCQKYIIASCFSWLFRPCHRRNANWFLKNSKPFLVFFSRWFKWKVVVFFNLKNSAIQVVEAACNELLIHTKYNAILCPLFIPFHLNNWSSEENSEKNMEFSPHHELKR